MSENAEPEELPAPDLRVGDFQLWVHRRAREVSAQSSAAGWFQVTVHCKAADCLVWLDRAILAESALVRFTEELGALARGERTRAVLEEFHPNLRLALAARPGETRFNMRVEFTELPMHGAAPIDFETERADILAAERACRRILDETGIQEESARPVPCGTQAERSVGFLRIRPGLQVQGVGFPWMVGRTVECAYHEPDWWTFMLGPPAGIGSSSPWRLLEQGRIRVSSADHRQQYGLPAPIDSAEKFNSISSGARVLRVEVREGTSDLILELEREFRLEFLPIASGYERWSVWGPDETTYVAQAGRVTAF
jgi:hypothetical protein